MRINRTMAGILALALVSVACSKQQNETGGTLSFSVETDSQVAEVTRSNVAGYTTLPWTGKFTIVVTGNDGKEVYKGLLEAYNATTALKAGNYTVKANYGSTSEEGFDKPCFKGEKTFSITGGGNTTVSIPVKLANSMIRMEYSDNFKAYYTDYSFTVKTGGGTEISFPKGETKAAFVDAYTISITGTLKNQGGKEQVFTKAYTQNLSPKTCYTVKFDVSNVGTGAVKITFDDTVDDVALADVDLNNK